MERRKKKEKKGKKETPALPVNLLPYTTRKLIKQDAETCPNIRQMPQPLPTHSWPRQRTTK